MGRKRPAGLPSFKNPPLNEVVLDVQFAPLPNYTAVDAGAVWALFKEDYPKVQEKQILPPIFTFVGDGEPMGLSHAQQFAFGGFPVGVRLWFVSEDGSHLIQFQRDRFILNWRKRGENAYPRFERVQKEFCDNFRKLNDYAQKKWKHELAINHANIKYLNYIRMEKISDIGKWLDTKHANASEDVQDPVAQKPLAIFSQSMALGRSGSVPTVLYELDFIGKPEKETLESASDFLHTGRVQIVTRFDATTTAHAHAEWGKN